MIIGFDIGNTHIVTGIYNSDGSLLLNFRVASDTKLTEDQFFSYLKNICDFNKVDLKEVEGVIISSVVPSLIDIFKWLAKKYFNTEAIMVGMDLNVPFSFKEGLDSSGFGADRLIDVVKGVLLYPNKNIMIFDFGTATTYEVLSNSVYIGGGIIPGVHMSINALFSNTSKLPKVKFDKPQTILGRNTVEQIQAGMFYGYTGQIKEIIKKVKEQVEDLHVIATGGLGRCISAELTEIDEYLPNLATDGLFELYELNKKTL
jgi:type III pantothenate kinase